MEALSVPEHSLVRVSWVDSNFVSGWHPRKAETHSFPTIITVGFVSHCDGKVLEIASTVGTDDGAKLNPLSVPWVCITECKVYNRRKDASGTISA